MSDANDGSVSREGTRMRGRFWRTILNWLGISLYILALGFVILTAWAASMSVTQLGWGSEAAAWVQAGGSIAAIAGAAWLAQSEARRARKLRRERDEETAWYVRFAINQAQFESHIIAADLLNPTIPVDKESLRGWRQQATTSATSLNALVSRTDYIHPAVTQVVSNAKVLMDDLVKDLTIASNIVQRGEKLDADLIGQIVGPHSALLELVSLYDARMRGIKLALDESGDALPIKKWASWQNED